MTTHQGSVIVNLTWAGLTVVTVCQTSIITTPAVKAAIRVTVILWAHWIQAVMG